MLRYFVKLIMDSQVDEYVLTMLDCTSKHWEACKKLIKILNYQVPVSQKLKVTSVKG